MKIFCPICNKISKKIIKLDKYPLYQFPTRNLKKTSYTLNTSVNFCKNCVYSFLFPIPSKKILNRFYNSEYDDCTTEDFSKGIDFDNEIQRITDFINKNFIKNNNKYSIVEIGGFDGKLLLNLSNKKQDKLLIEPSKFGSNLAKKSGISVINNFLNKNSIKPFKHKFDLVICRHVIEHVNNPKIFLNLLTDLINENGKVFLETPHLSQIIKYGNLKVIQLQHLHYFSLNTINQILNKEFNISKIFKKLSYDPTRELLAIEISKKKSKKNNIIIKDENKILISNLKNLNKKINYRNNKLTNILQKWVNDDLKIWIWGASSIVGELFTMYNQKINFFIGIIDSDTKKQKMLLPRAKNLKITTFDRALKEGVDCVLICASAVQSISKFILKNNKKIKFTDIYSLNTLNIK